MTDMTKKEQVVYDYIVWYRKAMGNSPSMWEIATGVGLHSVSTVHWHVHSLIDKGWLLSLDNGYRAVPV